MSDDGVVLFQAPRLWGLPNPSPFCVKVETWLRVAGIPYTSKRANPIKAPRGKVPWIVHGANAVADSEAILAYFRQTFGDRLGDGGLNPQQQTLGHLVRRTLEEGTYFVALHARWCEDEHWPTTRAGFFDPLGFPMGQVVGTMIRRRVKANAHAQGTARLTPEERSAAGIADWNAVSEVLGDKPYLLGDEPHSVDCTVYGFLIQALWAPYDTPMQRHTRADARLVAYAERFRARWWTT